MFSLSAIVLLYSIQINGTKTTTAALRTTTTEDVERKNLHKIKY